MKRSTACRCSVSSPARLAEAGYFVVRYDKRGIGQSGGRTENAGIAEYADDVVAIVTWLRKRKDVDGDRVAIVGPRGRRGHRAHGSRSRKAHPDARAPRGAGQTGRELTIDQQQQLLTQLNEPEASRQTQDCAPVEGDGRGHHRQRLGCAPAGTPTPGRYALVQELAAVRSGGGTRQDQAAGAHHPRRAGHADPPVACRPAQEIGSSRKNMPPASHAQDRRARRQPPAACRRRPARSSEYDTLPDKQSRPTSRRRSSTG